MLKDTFVNVLLCKIPYHLHSGEISHLHFAALPAITSDSKHTLTVNVVLFGALVWILICYYASLFSLFFYPCSFKQWSMHATSSPAARSEVKALCVCVCVRVSLVRTPARLSCCWGHAFLITWRCVVRGGTNAAKVVSLLGCNKMLALALSRALFAWGRKGSAGE